MRTGASDETWRAYRRASWMLWAKWGLVGFAGLLAGVFGFVYLGGSRGIGDAWMFIFPGVILVYLLYQADLRALSRKYFR